jgi:hypothetical protein
MKRSKREFLKAGAGVAAMVAMPGALAQTPAGWQPSARYPDPAVKAVDPSFNRYRLALAKVERIASNCRWNEGPVWFGDGSLPPVERHPEQSHHALGRGDRRRERVPQALEQRQRQYARPPGTAAHLRARRAARDAHRVRRHDHA